LTTKGKIEKDLDDLELKVGEIISCQVELWKKQIVTAKELSLLVMLRRCSVSKTVLSL
jgi:hypothetical protein